MRVHSHPPPYRMICTMEDGRVRQKCVDCKVERLSAASFEPGFYYNGKNSKKRIVNRSQKMSKPRNA